ncbi:MAG: hypothetical protein AAGH72_13020 [Verrucomicrobiota bacterium]
MRRTLHSGLTGFTLLEICLCLLILGVIFGVAIPLSASLFKSHPLEEQARSFQSLVNAAALASSESGYPYSFRFERKQIIHFAEDDTDNASNLVLAPNERYQIQLWPSERWQEPDGESWSIPPEGLILPLSIKWMEGDSWIALSISPLSGETLEMTYELH